MTAPDVRTAAREAATRHFPGMGEVQARKRKAFIHGAVWGAALVTPTREQIAEALRRDTRLCHPDGEPVDWSACADAILALMERG